VLLSVGVPIHASAAEEAASDAAEDQAAIVVYGRNDGYTIDTASSPTKTNTPLLDVPQSVAIMNRAQLDDQAVDSLQEALRYVPGIVLGQGEGHRDQVTLRGQNSTADFFLDGLRDDAQYYRPLYNTERVEVLKGSNAMIFGRGGGGGVINRVSKLATPGDTFGAMSASVGTWGDWTVAGDVNLSLAESAGLRINATHEDFASHRDAYGGHFTGIAPTLGLDLGEATRLVIAYELVSDRRTVDRGIPSLGGRPLAGVRDDFFGVEAVNRSKLDAHIGRARLDHEFSDSLSANLTAQYAQYDKFYANIFPRSATAATVTLEGYNSTTVRENAIVQGNLIWRGETGPVGHTLLAGFEASWQDTDAGRTDAVFTVNGVPSANSGPIPLRFPLAVPVFAFGAAPRSTRSHVEVLSGYIQDQIAIGEHFQIVAGIRHDTFRISSRDLINGFNAQRRDAKWSPRLGVIIKPRENISFYGSYAISFLPQSGDQFAALDATTATLAPEKFSNLEAGLKWDFTSQLGLTAAVYRLHRTNTRFNPPVGAAILTGESRSQGFEVALNGRITDQLQASIGYARQDGKVRSATAAAPAGRRLAQLPKHQFTLWTRYDFTPRIGAGLGVLHQSAQFTTISNAVRLPALTRLDAALFFDVSDRFALQINAENLTNESYFPSAQTDNNISTGEPFNVKATARIKF
jgi:catecholate siderophore receptor